MDLVEPFEDFARGRRRPFRLVGRHLHDEQIGGVGGLHQRDERRVGDIAAVPIGFALDLDRVVDERQAGRGQHRLDA